MVTGIILAGIAMVPDFVMPTPRDAALLIMLGTVGGLAQVLLTTAYRGAPVAVIALVRLFSHAVGHRLRFPDLGRGYRIRPWRLAP